MSHIPIPIKAVLGLAATAVDEARKLPDTLPTAVTTAPMIAASTAMHASLRIQQQIATMAARGDEVISKLRRTSPEPPAWAVFDDPPVEAPAEIVTKPRTAFDLIDYEHTGFSEGEDSDHTRWDAVGTAVTNDDEPGTGPSSARSSKSLTVTPRPVRAPAKKAAAKRSRAKRAAAKQAPTASPTGE
jgi:hypothetical protein